MSNVVRSAAVRLTMDNASYIRGGDQAAAATERATGRIQRSVRRTAASTGRDWDTMGRYGGRFALATGAGLAYAEKRILTFDKTMSTVAAVTEASAAQQAELRRAAIQAGADTAFTATEAAQAISEEGKAGISTANILKGGLRGALNLAAAGQLDVASAAEYTATAMVQFHLRGTESTHVADLLAASANKAQGEVTDMALALSYVGVPAHSARISLEQTIGTIALLAKNGLIGERAGTSLRGVLASLQAPSNIASKVMKKYGIDVYDAAGRLKGFNGIAQELHDRLGPLTDEERQYALGKIFGNQQLQAANILLESGARGVNKMTREVNDQGYAAEVANKKLDNLAGDWERFTGTLEADFINAGTGAQTALRDIVQQADQLAHIFAGLPTDMQEGIVKIAILATAVGGVLYTISKIRNVTRDIRGLGRGAQAKGGLGGAASLAAPVPVFVTNLGAGGLLGAGKGGGTTILAGGGAAGEAAAGRGILGRLRAFRLPAGTGIVATLGGLALMATGVTGKTHTGSSVGGGLIGGQIFGVPGALVGTSLGALRDVYNSGNDAADALDKAKKALESGTIKEQRDALADLRKEAEKLANGGWGQNFARGVTELTGRRQEIEDVGTALQETLDESKYSGDMLWLVSGGRMGKKPKNAAPDPLSAKPAQESLADLLNPKGPRRPKQPKAKTSEDVLAEIYGINPKKLKPVPLLDRILGVLGTNDTPTAGGKHTKNALRQFTVDLGLNPKAFDSGARHVKSEAKKLDALAPKVVVTANTDPAVAAIQKVLARNWSTIISVFPFVHQPSGPTVKHPARGGLMVGPGTGTSDSIPAYVSNGEYVMRAAAVAKYGVHMFDRYNAMRYAGGGAVGSVSRSGDGEVGRLSGSLRELRHELDQAKRSLSAETRLRDDLNSKREQLVSQVTSSLTSDLFTKKGAFDSGANIVGGALGTLTSDVSRARRFTALEKQLGKRGLHGGALDAIESTGDLSVLQAFAGASSADVASFQRLFTQRASLTGAAGAQAGTAYAREQKAATHELKLLRQEVKRLEKAIDRSADRVGDKINGAAATGHRRRH